ncbi:hypothetical protein M8J77_025980 [Diaphorina citri]|nr:hypothetical protein M8J77_025980 [Diaphorina citri]
MDSFKVSTVGGKLKLVFDGHTYGYSNPIGNSGCHWTCVLKPCSAHVNTNKTKTKIIGGDYVHTHDKDPSKRNSTTREKNSPSTVKTKPSTDMSGQPGPATPKGPPPAAPAPNAAPSTDISGQSRPATPSGPPAPDPALTTPGDTATNSLLIQRDAAIDTIVTKEREKEELEAELADCKVLISNLQDSIRTIEAAWDADKAELENLRKQVSASRQLSCSSSSGSSRKKLSIVGDSHVHNLEPVLRKVFPPSYDIKCYPRSGASVEDICTLSVRQHGPEDIVILFVGTNDVCKKSWSSLEASFVKLIEKFKGCKLVVILVPPRRNSDEFNNHIHSLNVKISNLIKNKGVSYVNPASVLRNKHYSRDNLHLNKLGKTSICQMLKSNVINGTQFADLTKPNNSHTGSNRANLSKVTSNKKTRATHETNTRAKGSTRHQNSTGNTGSANGQTPRSRYSRYSPNSQYTRDEMQGRDGARWRKGKGKGKGTQHVGRNKDSRVNTRVFYNNTYRGPAYYPPPPPPFPDHYDYGFPPFPPHPYDYGYYYDVEPYSYPYEDHQGTSRGMTRNTDTRTLLSHSEPLDNVVSVETVREQSQLLSSDSQLVVNSESGDELDSPHDVRPLSPLLNSALPDELESVYLDELSDNERSSVLETSLDSNTSVSNISASNDTSTVAVGVGSTYNTQVSLSRQRLFDNVSPYAKCFRCVHLNAQSLSAHIHEISSLIEDVDLHAVLISESWLKPSISDNIVNIPGYVLVRHDRTDRRAGGVAIFLRNDLKHKVVMSSSVSSHDNRNVEFLAVELVLRCVRLLVVVVYKPPNVHQLGELYDFITLSIPNYEHIIMMGDFNINMLNSSVRATQNFLNTISTFSLSVLPSAPTHHSPGHPSSLIDLTIVTRDDKVVRYDQIPAPGVSHHDLLFLAYSVKVPKYPAQIVSYRNIKKIDMERFSECLSEVDWSGVEADVTIDDKVSIFNQHVQQVFDIFAPVKESRVTKAPIPWMTPAIKSSMPGYITSVQSEEERYKLHG